LRSFQRKRDASRAGAPQPYHSPAKGADESLLRRVSLENNGDVRNKAVKRLRCDAGTDARTRMRYTVIRISTA
jgi:hypothetical protein